MPKWYWMTPQVTSARRGDLVRAGEIEALFEDARDRGVDDLRGCRLVAHDFRRGRGRGTGSAERSGIDPLRPAACSASSRKASVEREAVATTVEVEDVGPPRRSGRCRRASARVNGRQLVVGHDVVDQSEAQRLGGVDEVAGDRQLGRLADADRHCGSSAVSPHAATTPSRAWVSAKRARSDATMNVQLSASSSAPVTQAPLTAQTTGVVTARSVAPGFVPRFDGDAVPDPAATSLKSTPALNTGSTAVTMIARASRRRRRPPRSARRTPRHASRPSSAFLTSGRLIVIVRTPSASSTSSNPSATGRLLRDAVALQPEARMALPRMNL